MRVVADLHIHSRYARATSPSSDLKTLSEYAKIKGVNLLATGDFTHPLYLKEIKSTLTEWENGTSKMNGVYFVLGTEISVVWERFKMHHLLFAPDLEIVEQLCDEFSKYSALESDGRPILSLSSEELAEIVFSVSDKCVIVPAHAWTPWFSIFGSRSGVDSIEEAFGKYASKIFAIETGLSSDPAMNWLLSSLDEITLISNSDAHSPQKIGREANVFELKEPAYEEIFFKAIKRREGFIKTYEFYPEEGKYHYDGHRKCGISLAPEESERYNNRCPKCGKKLTLGVLHRITELADRKKANAKNRIPFQHIIPLPTVISKVLRKGENTVSVMKEYMRIVKIFGSEFAVFEAEKEEIRKRVGGKIGEAIIKVKEGSVKWMPGFDGVFGRFEFSDSESTNKLLNY